MAEVWSFNTTIRNPERMENMLRTLSEMEGLPFDLQGQKSFFKLQIKKRLYKPSKAKLADATLIAAVHADLSADDLDDDTVGAIVEKYHHDSVDASGRGRTAAGILNRFGLCVALQSKGPVVITPLGKKWLNHEVDDEELFTKFFLKWQYPNYLEAGYASFDIKPFIGVVALITKVNERWAELHNSPVGISKEEYRLFVPTLTKAAQLDDYVRAIIDYRTTSRSLSGRQRADFTKNFALQRVHAVFGPNKPVTKALNDLRDYADASIRYFRMSGLLAERGGKTHIDIASDKQVEAASLLTSMPLSAEVFDSYETYFNYLSDIEALDLPWQNETDRRNIVAQLVDLSRTEANEIGLDVSHDLMHISEVSTGQQVEKLGALLNEIRIRKLRGLKHNLSVLEECIEKLSTITDKHYQPLTARPSLDFEWYTAQSLMVLNDAMSIEPSFKVGDDGIPTGFRANVADIACDYMTFGMTVEVTLLLGRDQWIAEGQPVMRHLRDFEDKLDNKQAYCLFIAPCIHRDAVNTFWMSNKHAYEGKRQTIIPLTLEQFLTILKAAHHKIDTATFAQTDINNLLLTFMQAVDDFENPFDWLEHFSTYISEWV